MSPSGTNLAEIARAEEVSSAQAIQMSTCSAMASASSTSIPKYRTVLSILLPAGNRIDYLPRRTMRGDAVHHQCEQLRGRDSQR
jgi:hypothetical protein